jgi:hypothetical protein
MYNSDWSFWDISNFESYLISCKKKPCVFYVPRGCYVEERAETRSERARHIILRKENEVYYVDMVKVHLRKGEQTQKAVFHARKAENEHFFDLDLEIPYKLYDILVDYTKLGDPDLLLVLSMENSHFRWAIVSESFLERQLDPRGSCDYVV